MSAQFEERKKQTPNEAVEAKEEVLLFDDPSDWGLPRSAYAKRRAEARPKFDPKERWNPKLQDAYIGAQLLLANSLSDRQFEHRMESMTALLNEFATDEAKLSSLLTRDGTREFKRNALEHFALELSTVAAGAVLYGPSGHVTLTKAGLQRLASLRSGALIEGYGALLYVYAAGVAAVVAEDAEALRELVFRPMYIEFISGVRFELEFDLYRVMRTCADYGSGSEVRERVTAWIQPIISILTGMSKAEADEAIVRFELLYYLIRPYVETSPSVQSMRPFFDLHLDDRRQAAEVLGALYKQMHTRNPWFQHLFNSKRHAEDAFAVLMSICEADPPETTDETDSEAPSTEGQG